MIIVQTTVIDIDPHKSEDCSFFLDTEKSFSFDDFHNFKNLLFDQISLFIDGVVIDEEKIHE